MSLNCDFSGWATKNDLRCSDGRTILRDAFKENDQKRVPLVWNHQHNDPNNILGHAILENRNDGVYAYCFFNETENAKAVKEMVRHGDLKSLSIFANQLKQDGSKVVHGMIREVSLVVAGANPGAFIDSIMEHSDGTDEAAVIYYGEAKASIDELEHAYSESEAVEEIVEEKIEHAEKEENKGEPEMEEPKKKTIKDVLDTFNEEQKTALHAIIGNLLEEEDDDETNNEGEPDMKHNVFDSDSKRAENVLSHAEMEEIINDAQRGTLKEAVLAHGIDQIDILFPDAQNVTKTPQWIKREDGWVSKVMNGTHHSPFSRIKSLFADITADEARARGYIKGNRKEEEVFTLLKRITEPQTIYKKQAFDRDDVIDITDFDVVSWTKSEMRAMLDEEIARAILVGDGRSTASNDKIKTDRVRPIWTDDDLYTIKKTVSVTAGSSDEVKAKAFIKACKKARKDYKGSGNPALFTTEDVLTDCLLIEDSTGRIIYDTEEKLRTALRVKEIITVPVMENLTRVVGLDTRFLMGIIVNLEDYNVGADKGGAVNMFDDFDIDYNKQKYLIETRCSGALIKPFSAIAVELVYGSAVLTVEAEDPTDTILGKVVNTLQDNIVVSDTGITGTLKYVTGYTGYSGNPAEQSGNFLALKFTAPAGSTTTVELIGGTAGVKTLDSDMNLVARITNKRTQKLRVISTTSGGDKLTKVLDLSLLTLENA